MADEEVKKDQESEETTDNQKKGGKLKFILIPIIILVQVVAAYYIVFNILLKHPNHVEEPKRKKENLEVGLFYEINDIVVNTSGSGGRRYIVIEVGLETAEQKVVDEATSKEIWIRDAILTLLISKTSEELMDISARKMLKKEIMGIINRKLAEGQFKNIYFKKYIIQ